MTPRSRIAPIAPIAPTLASTLGSRLLRVSLLPALLLGAAIGACTSEPASDCSRGTNGCECVNGQCYPGLTCGVGLFANICFPNTDGGGDGGGETECTQASCAGFTWCDVESGQCVPGCEFDDQCAGEIVCDTASHSCECPAGTFECVGASPTGRAAGFAGTGSSRRRGLRRQQPRRGELHQPRLHERDAQLQRVRVQHLELRQPRLVV